MNITIRLEKEDVIIREFFDNAILIEVADKDLNIVLSAELVDELYNDLKELKNK